MTSDTSRVLFHDSTGGLPASEVTLAEIDLRHHQGVHPRVGAVDVVPFVPISGVTMADCVEMAAEQRELTIAAPDPVPAAG